ncbi:Uncharacterised protein [Enterobacter hormaechei]|nr:Uncharacterised protein [Enterobacter hormaechei]
MARMNLCRCSFNHSLCLVLVEDASETKCQARALDKRLVAKHAGRVGLPWLSVAFALSHVLGDDCRVLAVFAVNLAGARAFLFVVKELHAVKLRMFVDNASPSINADDRDNPAFIWKCVNLFGPWVQAVLVGDDQQGCELLVRDVATFERCIL